MDDSAGMGSGRDVVRREEFASFQRQTGTAFSEIRDEMRSFRREFHDFTERAKPDVTKMLGVAAGVASVLLGIVTAVGGLVAWGLNSRLDRSETRDDRMAQQIEVMGPTVTRLEANERRVMALDTTLQREMRLLDGAISARMDALDKVLQREMSQADALVVEKVKSLSERLDASEGWIDRIRWQRETGTL